MNADRASGPLDDPVERWGGVDVRSGRAELLADADRPGGWLLLLDPDPAVLRRPRRSHLSWTSSTPASSRTFSTPCHPAHSRSLTSVAEH